MGGEVAALAESPTISFKKERRAEKPKIAQD
jgi:hypothetical protein